MKVPPEIRHVDGYCFSCCPSFKADAYGDKCLLQDDDPPFYYNRTECGKPCKPYIAALRVAVDNGEDLPSEHADNILSMLQDIMDEVYQLTRAIEEMS